MRQKRRDGTLNHRILTWYSWIWCAAMWGWWLKRASEPEPPCEPMSHVEAYKTCMRHSFLYGGLCRNTWVWVRQNLCFVSTSCHYEKKDFDTRERWCVDTTLVPHHRYKTILQNVSTSLTPIVILPIPLHIHFHPPLWHNWPHFPANRSTCRKWPLAPP